MNKIKLFFHLLFFFIIYSGAFAQEIDSIAVSNDLELTASNPIVPSKVAYSEIIIDSVKTDSVKIPKKNIAPYPPLQRDYRRLGYDTSMYLGVTVIAFGILWVMPQSISGWNKQDIKEQGLTSKWLQNVKAGPVWDEDDWVLNYVTHPYSGAVYFMTARSSGFTFLESFAYSAIMSTFFWEYGVEAFAEVPSTQDLIVTPVIGSAMGEALFYAKKSILKHDKRILKSKVLGVTTLILIDPFNTFLDACGYEQKVKPQMNIAPVGYDYGNNKAIWGVTFTAQF